MEEVVEAAEAEDEEVVDSSPTKVKGPGGAPNTQIFHLEIGRDAECIISLGNKLFSALTQPTALGKTFTSPSQPSNERLTSSANIYKLTHYTQCCILKTIQWKYMMLLIYQS